MLKSKEAVVSRNVNFTGIPASETYTNVVIQSDDIKECNAEKDIKKNAEDVPVKNKKINSLGIHN